MIFDSSCVVIFSIFFVCVYIMCVRHISMVGAREWVNERTNQQASTHVWVHALLIQSQLLWKPMEIKIKKKNNTPTQTSITMGQMNWNKAHLSEWKQEHQSKNHTAQNNTWERVCPVQTEQTIECLSKLCVRESEEHFYCENLQLSVNFINILLFFFRTRKKFKYFRNFIHGSLSGKI